MSKSLIKTLLRIVQTQEESYSAGAALKQFCQDHGVGQRHGIRWKFTDTDRQKLGFYLKNIHGVEPETQPDAWTELDRHEAAKIGGNEKLTQTRVMAGRVALKALPGRPLCINGSSLLLPEAINLDMLWSDVRLDEAHDSVLVIENWENFQLAHQTPLLKNLPGNPLVVFRGDPNAYNPKDSLALLHHLKRPVDAFVDFDPEGLVIANALPYFRSMVCPSGEVLENLLANAKNQDRFTLQKKEAIATLLNLKHAQLQALWLLFDRHGQALPQELLIG